MPVDFEPLPAGTGVDFEPEANPDAIHVGGAPTAADIGVADANPASPMAAPVRPGVSRGKAFARGAVAGGTFGLFSVLNSAADQAGQKLLPQAALDFLQKNAPGEGLPINEPHTYDERRAAYQDLLHKAQQDHAGYFTAGEIAGSIAAPVPGAAGAGKLAAKGAEKLGAKVIGQGLIKAGIEGGVAGAVYGAGGAAGEGQSATDIAKAAGKGFEIGDLTGTALHGAAGLTGLVAKKASKALQEKYVQLFGSEVLGNASKKATKQGWAQILGKEAEEGVEQDAAKKYVQSKELAPVEAAAARHDYGDAIEQIDQRLSKMSPGRQANYEAINATEPYQVGEGLAAIDKQAFKARNMSKNPQALKALERAREEWIKDFSSADAKQVRSVLGSATGVSEDVAAELGRVADNLPSTGRVSRGQWAKAAQDAGASPEALQYMTNIENAEYEKGTPAFFKWDPKATIPAQELRAEATKRQQSAMAAFDSLMPQFNTETKKAVKVAINDSLERYLDRAAAKSPIAAEAVKRIRNDDVKFSVLLAAKQGLKEQSQKQTQDAFKAQQLIKFALHGGGGLAAAGIAGNQGQKAAQEAQEGHYLGALEHGAIAAGAGAFAGKAALNPLSRLNNRAPGFLQMVGRLPAASPAMSRPVIQQATAPQPPQQPVDTTTFGTAGNQ